MTAIRNTGRDKRPAPASFTMSEADRATVRRLAQQVEAAVSFRSTLSRGAAAHDACGDADLAGLVRAEIARVSDFVTLLDAELLVRGGGLADG